MENKRNNLIGLAASMFKACGVHTTIEILELNEDGIARPTGEIIKT